jgi:hypothetical protein
MAILDAFLTLSDAQAVTTSAASTNILDTKSELGDALEKGAWLRVAVQTAFVIPDAPTNDITNVILMSADDTAFNTGPVTHVQTAAFDESVAVAGKELLVVKLPKNVKRYVRLYYTMGSTATAGNIDAHILLDVDSLITDVEPA